MKKLFVLIAVLFLGGCQTSSLLDLLPVGQRLWNGAPTKTSPINVGTMLADIRASKTTEAGDQPSCKSHTVILKNSEIGVTELLELEEFVKISRQYDWPEVQIVSNPPTRSSAIEHTRVKVQIAKFIKSSAPLVRLEKDADFAQAFKLVGFCVLVTPNEVSS